MAQINVLEQYCRICGIQPDPSRDRAQTIALIKQALTDFTEFDEQLLGYTTVSSEGFGGKWLLNNRQALEIKAEFEATMGTVSYFLGNLTENKGKAQQRLTALLRRNEVDMCCEILLNEGYSLNETLHALRAMHYEADIKFKKTGGREENIPLFVISKQPRTWRWWKPWVAETGDMTFCDPLAWELDYETAKRLKINPMIFARHAQETNFEITDLKIS
jgi:hypothetical protein